MSNMKPDVKARRRQEVRDRDGPACYICGQIPAPQKETLDHFIAKRDGGNHRIENLRIACYECNHRRHNNI